MSQGRKSLLTLRFVIIVIALAVGIALLVRGNYVIGALITGGAVLRAVLVVSLARRFGRFDRSRGRG